MSDQCKRCQGIGQIRESLMQPIEFAGAEKAPIIHNTQPFGCPDCKGTGKRTTGGRDAHQ